MTVPVSNLQSVTPSAIIELFELKLTAALHGSNDTYRFHAGVNSKSNGGAVVWDGRTYQAYPVEADGFEYTGNGQLPRPKLRVSNQLGLITAILLQVNTTSQGNDLVGAKLTRIRVLAKHLDATNFPDNVNPYGTPDPTAELPREIYYIARKTVENRDRVEFELASAFDLAGVTAPRRVCIANMCNWVYRSSECGYTGDAYFDDNDQSVGTLAEDVCSKRLAGCEARFAPVTVTGTVSLGSSTLSGLSSSKLNQIATSDPISGFGIPSGTIVAAKGATSLTMSNAATASTNVTRTGTLVSPDGVSMTVSTTAGMAPGMLVAGADVPSGTRISSISGTTLTLTIAYNANSKGSLTTKSATVTSAYYLTLEDVSGVEVGDLAGNTAGVTNETPHGDNFYTGTRVLSISGNQVYLSKPTLFSTFSLTFSGALPSFTAAFWRPVTFQAATYTFTAPSGYTIRADNNLPFGSFPGVGGFYG